MELTEIRGSLFGYKKSDVIRYINELNDLHSATVDNKDFEYNTLKDETDAVIKNLKDTADTQKTGIDELTAQIESITAELTATASALGEYKEMYESLFAETEDLRILVILVAEVLVVAGVIVRGHNVGLCLLPAVVAGNKAGAVKAVNNVVEHIVKLLHLLVFLDCVNAPALV